MYAVQIFGDTLSTRSAIVNVRKFDKKTGINVTRTILTRIEDTFYANKRVYTFTVDVFENLGDVLFVNLDC